MIYYYNFIRKYFILVFFLLSNFSIYKCILKCKCNDHSACLTDRTKEVKHDFCIIADKGHCYSAKVVDITYDVDEKQPQQIIGRIVQRYGCLSMTSKSLLSCNIHFINLTSPVAIGCCNTTDYCNSAVVPSFYHHMTDVNAIKYAINHRNKQQSNDKNPNFITPGSYQKQPHFLLIIIISCVMLFLIFIGTIAILIFMNRCKFRQHIRQSKLLLHLNNGNNHLGQMNMTSCPQSGYMMNSNNINNPAVASIMTSSSLMTNSTSLVGLSVANERLMIQRTVAHQIMIRQLIGKGRFSEIWAGEWMGDPVTIRLMTNNISLGYVNISEQLWLRTVALYYSCVLRHSAVVGLLGSDKVTTANYIPDSSCSGSNSTIVRPMLLYPHFPLGTLLQLMHSTYWLEDSPQQDLASSDPTASHPTSNTQNKQQTLTRMAFSIISGLCYLHTEIAATKGKPSIAHRNLKPSNIYVKDDYSCCIGDLEWAIVANQSSTQPASMVTINSNQSNSNGTAALQALPDFESSIPSILISSAPRYCAPEFVEYVVHGRNFQSISIYDYKKADVYSLGLILWELTIWFYPQIRSNQTSSQWVYEPAYQQELNVLRRATSSSPQRLSSQMTDRCDPRGYDPTLKEIADIVVRDNTRPNIQQWDLTQHDQPMDKLDQSLSANEGEGEVEQEEVERQTLTTNLKTESSSTSSIGENLLAIIPQCWLASPNSRLTLLNIKKFIINSQYSNCCHDNHNLTTTTSTPVDIINE